MRVFSKQAYSTILHNILDPDFVLIVESGWLDNILRFKLQGSNLVSQNIHISIVKPAFNQWNIKVHR